MDLYHSLLILLFPNVSVVIIIIIIIMIIIIIIIIMIIIIIISAITVKMKIIFTVLQQFRKDC